MVLMQNAMYSALIYITNETAKCYAGFPYFFKFVKMRQSGTCALVQSAQHDAFR